MKFIINIMLFLNIMVIYASSNCVYDEEILLEQLKYAETGKDSLRLIEFHSRPFREMPMEQDNTLGCVLDTICDSEYDSLILAKADSMVFVETNRHFNNDTKIYAYYKFNLIPCLKLFDICCSMPLADPFLLNYQRVLYDTCTEVIYHFGGGPLQYHKVIASFLHDNYDEKNVMELTKMYLDTYYGYQFAIILNSVDDFYSYYSDDLADTSRLSSDWFSRKECVEKCAEVVKANLVPPNIDKRNNYYDITISVLGMNQENGKFNLDVWNFRISRDDFQVLNRESIVTEGLDPYIQVRK